MLKVLIGWVEQEHGTVEVSAAGLVYAGPDPEHVRGIVERKRDWYDRTGGKHLLTDEELVRSLPYCMHGSLWAVYVDGPQGVTRDQPRFDPFGDIWKSR